MARVYVLLSIRSRTHYFGYGRIVFEISLKRSSSPKPRRLLITAAFGAATAPPCSYGSRNSKHVAPNLAFPSNAVICRRRAESETRLNTSSSLITQTWRGKPLFTTQTIGQFIAAITTRTRLNVKAKIDHATYLAGAKVTDDNGGGQPIPLRLPRRMEVSDRLTVSIATASSINTP